MDAGFHGKLVIKAGVRMGEEFRLTQDQVIVGRDSSADLQLSDEAISRRHARITRQGLRFLLEDLGSSNGTYLNGQLVKDSRPLESGDEIRLGHAVTLLFQVQPPVMEPTRFVQLSEEGAPLDSSTRIETPHTLAGEFAGFDRSSAPPQLEVRVSGMPVQTYILGRDQHTLGRAEDNDIVIRSQIVSRHHARVERVGEDYDLVVLPGVTNPLLINGQPVAGRRRLSDGDEICVESALAGVSVSLAYTSPAGSRRHPEAPETLVRVSRPEQPISGQTILDAQAGLEVLKNPAQLIVTVAGNPTQAHPLLRDRITIGRSEDNDIVILSPIVSRHHARLERSPGGYQLVVLPEVTNTLVCQGKPIADRRLLQHGDILRIDSTIPGMMVTLVYHSPAEAASPEVQTVSFGEREKLTFGRDPANDVQLNVPTVSRYHAQVEKIGRRYRLADLHSANGTFVNAERVEGEVWLQPGDQIRIGPYRFELTENAFTQHNESSGLQVEALGLNKWVRKNLNILENISLVFQPREFIVVVGQSGGGKSTLVDAVAGYRPATHGRVLVNGIDVYRNFDAIRNEIGYVPQRDIIHMELTVYQALDYAARLRMPGDTSQDERHRRIMEVLEDLDLVHRKDVQISGLSGGQQKRVSIGVELLTRPGLFFLDEPTSGLDPGTETAFMHLMRRLADQGRTIVMVTHATKNVMLADKVVFLARGGYLAWFGPPDEALAYFDRYRSEREQRSRPMEFDQIYAILDDPSKGAAKDWAQRFQEHPAYVKYIQQPLQIRGKDLPLVASAQATPHRASRRPTASALRQLLTLSARNLKILTRDRSSMILMLLTAPLVGALDFVIAPLMGKDVFSYASGDPANGAITLFLLTINCLLVGGLSQMREIVKEGDIYRRERLVNLKIFPYVLSKVWIALLLAFYHALAYTLIRFVAFEIPGGALEFGLVYITLVLAVLAGMMGGLLVSALAPAASSAPILMILILIPQIVLSGALAPVPGTISSVASTRWAFQSLIGIVGIGSDIAADPCWRLSEELREAMSLDDKVANGCRCMGVNVFNPDSCNFPGIGQYYKPEVDQSEPAEPPPLGEKPPAPILPPAPEPPEDQYDSVAVAKYLNALQSYQDEATRIQEDYKGQMDIYEARAKVYQAEMATYQEALSKWSLARNGAVKGAEGLIDSVTQEFGWAWVDKGDSARFWPWLFQTWLAQSLIILVYFLVILGLMKRKDVK